MKETKHARFIRVAERRTNAVLEKIRILANCSNRTMYDYDDEEVKKVFSAIKRAVREAEQLFDDKPKQRFKLA